MSAPNGEPFEDCFTPRERRRHHRIMRSLGHAGSESTHEGAPLGSEAERRSEAGEPLALLVIGLALILVGVVLVSSLAVITGALVSLTALVVAARRARFTPPSS